MFLCGRGVQLWRRSLRLPHLHLPELHVPRKEQMKSVTRGAMIDCAAGYDTDCNDRTKS